MTNVTGINCKKKRLSLSYVNVSSLTKPIVSSWNDGTNNEIMETSFTFSLDKMEIDRDSKEEYKDDDAMRGSDTEVSDDEYVTYFTKKNVKRCFASRRK